MLEKNISHLDLLFILILETIELKKQIQEVRKKLKSKTILDNNIFLNKTPTKRGRKPKEKIIGYTVANKKFEIDFS